MTIPRERLRVQAERGALATLYGVVMLVAGGVGWTLDVEGSGYVLLAGGSVTAAGTLWFLIPTCTAWRRGIIH